MKEVIFASFNLNHVFFSTDAKDGSNFFNCFVPRKLCCWLKVDSSGNSGMTCDDSILLLSSSKVKGYKKCVKIRGANEQKT